MSQKRPSSGTSYLVTFTSPSDLGQHCYVKGCHGRLSACPHPKCPCTPVGGVDLAVWNASCGRKWNALRRQLRRAYPGLEFFRGVEVQDGKRRRDGVGRGALHLHVLVRLPVGSFGLSLERLRDLAMSAGFGHSVDIRQSPDGQSSFAHYVSKYVGKACDEREVVPWHVTRARGPEVASPDPPREADRLALAALGDMAVAVAGPVGWHGVGGPVPVWVPEDGGYWLQVLPELQANGCNDFRAWSHVRRVTVATHRNWSCSQGWGFTMAAASAAAGRYAALKAAQARAATGSAPTRTRAGLTCFVPVRPDGLPPPG